MNGFFASFIPITQPLKKYKIEVVLLSLAILTTIISLIIFLNNNLVREEEITIEDDQMQIPIQNKIVIEIAGAVHKPGVYEINSGTRLNQVIKLAQGITNEANINYFNRNYNLARFVTDQEKIYVPYSWEIEQGIFVENSHILDYSQPNETAILPVNNKQQAKININISSLEELDQLPGIGPVTAQKIIQNRPYSTTTDLFAKKIVNKNVWEKIKDQITN